MQKDTNSTPNPPSPAPAGSAFGRIAAMEQVIYAAKAHAESTAEHFRNNHTRCRRCTDTQHELDRMLAAYDALPNARGELPPPR